MGIDINGLRLIYKFSKEYNLSNILIGTLGRQYIYFNEKQLRNFYKSNKITTLEKEVSSIFNKYDGYAEILFEIFFQNCKIESIDISSFEGANLIVDLNYSIDNRLHSRYDLLFDGGTLEHIYNFPQSIENCKKMIKKNGFFISITPFNNFCGHGFYQFSPELWFRIFDCHSGFEIKNVMLFEDKPFSKFIILRDPQEIRSRQIILSNKPLYGCIIAQKKSDTISGNYIYQSDYQYLWHKNSNKINDSKIKNNFIKKYYTKILNKFMKIFKKPNEEDVFIFPENSIKEIID